MKLTQCASVGVIAMLVSTTAFASVKKHPAAGTPPPLAPAITAATFEKQVQEAKNRGSRKTAAVDAQLESALSDSFRNLRNEIIGGPKVVDGKETAVMMPAMKSPEQLHALLKRLS